MAVATLATAPELDPGSDAETPFLLTRRELARLLRLSTRTVDRLRTCDAIPEPLVIGVKVLWRRSEIEQWVLLGCPDRKTFEARRRK